MHDPLLLLFEIKYPWRTDRCSSWIGYHKTAVSAWRRRSVPRWKVWRWHVQVSPWWTPEPVRTYCVKCGHTFEAFGDGAVTIEEALDTKWREDEAAKWADMGAAMKTDFAVGRDVGFCESSTVREPSSISRPVDFFSKSRA